MVTYDYMVVSGIFGGVVSAAVCACYWNARKEKKERKLAQEHTQQIIEDFRIDVENYKIYKKK